MTVKEFIDGYNKQLTTQMKEKYLKDNINLKAEYISFAEKISICEKIISRTYYKWDKNEEGFMFNTGIVEIKSALTYMFYCLSLIDSYITIDIDFNNSVNDFDLLNNTDFLDLFINRIPEKERKEFKMILDMTEYDTLKNDYEFNNILNKLFDRFNSIVNELKNPIIEALTSMVQE